jgi:hypothetical protein
MERTELDLTVEDHQKAFTEVSFLLEMLTNAINQTVGNSTPSLGISAGKQMGKKLPVYLVDPSLELVLAALSERLDAGFEFDHNCDASGANLEVTRCAIRDVCASRGLELGGELCKMFHYYLSGMAAELLKRPVRAGEFQAGESCTIRLNAK